MGSGEVEGNDKRHPNPHAVKALYQLIELAVLWEDVADFLEYVEGAAIYCHHFREAKNGYRTGYEEEEEVHLIFGNIS